MFSVSRARYAVKVLSASLLETLPLTSAPGRSTAARPTLTFQLHRSSTAEPFGVACVFGVSGSGDTVCFLRSINPALAASSSVLSSVLSGGSPAHHDALCVVSLNGELHPTEEVVRSVMRTSRDVVLQCAVEELSKKKRSTRRTTAAVEEEEGEEMSVEETTVQPTKRRGRKPKSAAKEEQQEEEEEKKMNADEALEDAAAHEKEEEEGGADTPAPKGRGRKPLKDGKPRRTMKRLRNQGTRSNPQPADADKLTAAGSEETEAASDPEDESPELDDDAVSAAAEATLTEDVMEALESMTPAAGVGAASTTAGAAAKMVKKRHRRTKAEMIAARQAAAAAGQLTQPRKTKRAPERGRKATLSNTVESANSEEEGEEEKEEAWFHPKKAAEDGEEEMEVEKAAPKKRGRDTGRKTKKMEEEEDADGAAEFPAAEKKEEKGRDRKSKGDKKAVAAAKRNRGTSKAHDSVTELTDGDAVESLGEESDSTGKSEKVEAKEDSGESMSF